jgi:hypothetical protein
MFRRGETDISTFNAVEFFHCTEMQIAVSSETAVRIYVSTTLHDITTQKQVILIFTPQELEIPYKLIYFCFLIK